MNLKDYLHEEFRHLHIDVQVHHFQPNHYIPNTAEHGISSITVAHPTPINIGTIRHVLDYAEFTAYICAYDLSTKEAFMQDLLAKRGYHGSFICTKPKPPDIQCIAAEGKLLKHLRTQENAYATT